MAQAPTNWPQPTPTASPTGYVPQPTTYIQPTAVTGPTPTPTVQGNYLTPTNTGTYQGSTGSGAFLPTSLPIVPSNGQTTTNNTGSGSGGTVNTNPTPSGPSQEELMQMQETDNAYNAAMDYLNKATDIVNSGIAGQQDVINQQYDVTKQTGTTQKAQGERAITTAKSDTASRLQNALTAARQALQESLMGGKQRFGSGSNIYKALGEYGTTKFQQASGQAKDTAERAYTDLQDQWQTLQENFNTSMSQLDAWKTQQMNSIQQWASDKLMEINQQRGEAAQNKSYQKIQILQNIRNAASAVNQQAETFKQNLILNAQANGQSIQSALRSFNQYAQTGSTNTAGTAANTINSINMNPLSATSKTIANTPTYTGAITGTPKYDELGNRIA